MTSHGSDWLKAILVLETRGFAPEICLEETRLIVFAVRPLSE